MIVLFLTGDFSGSNEAYWLLKLHCKYKSKLRNKGENKSEISKKQVK